MKKIATSDKDQKLGAMRERLIKKFPEIFKGSLKESHMKMEPVKIQMKEDGKKYHKPATTAREVPIFYKHKAKEMIKNMIEEGIIEEVTKPTEYCSRATFLPKSDGQSLRLVTDYRTINRMILRPSWPFTSSYSLIAQIQQSLPFIAAVDLLSGYHQVPLNEVSSDLTTFLTPYGKFKFKRAPMGLSPSGDWFNMQTDKLILGLDNCLKSVDDLFFQAASVEDLESLLETFFQ